MIILWLLIVTSVDLRNKYGKFHILFEKSSINMDDLPILTHYPLVNVYIATEHHYVHR